MSKNTLNFENVYTMNYQYVLNWIRRSVNSSVIAEEITSDVFMKVHEHLNTFDEEKASISTWLITIANRKIIDWFRKQKNEQRTTSISEYTDESGKEVIQIVSNTLIPDQIIENKRINDAINKSISELSDKYREVAEMHFLNQYNYGEISEYLNIPLGTVKGSINRIRAKLSVSLKEKNVNIAS